MVASNVVSYSSCNKQNNTTTIQGRVRKVSKTSYKFFSHCLEINPWNQFHCCSLACIVDRNNLQKTLNINFFLKKGKVVIKNAKTQSVHEFVHST